MLKQRILTAIVLLALLIPALWVDAPWPFALLSLLMIGAAGWEWARLNALPGLGAHLMGGAVMALCVAALQAVFLQGSPAENLLRLWWVGTLLWVIGGSAALYGGVGAWPLVPRVLRWLLGMVLLVLAWLAIMAARAKGLNFLFSIFCLVWMADSAAYFGGRAWGRRKLAPTISPGKSWAGAYTGAVAVLVMAGVWQAVEGQLGAAHPSLFGLLMQRYGWLGLVACSVFLTVFSVVGDLFESLIKRSAGAKDSSQLLPGHGGVLDRVDALLPVFPIAMWVVSV
jgi:phosphatidate cytidylyltransferase